MGEALSQGSAGNDTQSVDHDAKSVHVPVATSVNLPTPAAADSAPKAVMIGDYEFDNRFFLDALQNFLMSEEYNNIPKSFCDVLEDMEDADLKNKIDGVIAMIENISPAELDEESTKNKDTAPEEFKKLPKLIIIELKTMKRGLVS